MMKVAFFSSVLNHHQIEFCDNMYKMHGDNFIFISTMDIEQERIKLGYTLYERPYNLKMHISEKHKMVAYELFQTADIVILGVLLEDWLRERLKNGKITFLYKERLFKEKPSLYWRLRCLVYVIREYYPYRNNQFYMLAASQYAPSDYNSLRTFKNKCFSWGYFPPIKIYEDKELKQLKTSDYVSILWAGRLINWKHPEFVIEIGKTLKENKSNFRIDVAGTGPMEQELRDDIIRQNLSDVIYIHGAMSPDCVRNMMDKTNIFLFTSDRREGFGAVLVEAMNSGCAVVASNTAGATGLLVKDNENGMIYDNDSIDQIKELVLQLADNPNKTMMLGYQAYEYIRKVHNSIIAANRFTEVAKAMMNGTILPNYEIGPMKKM